MQLSVCRFHSGHNVAQNSQICGRNKLWFPIENNPVVFPLNICCASCNILLSCKENVFFLIFQKILRHFCVECAHLEFILSVCMHHFSCNYQSNNYIINLSIYQSINLSKSIYQFISIYLFLYLSNYHSYVYFPLIYVR